MQGTYTERKFKGDLILFFVSNPVLWDKNKKQLKDDI